MNIAQTAHTNVSAVHVGNVGRKVIMMVTKKIPFGMTKETPFGVICVVGMAITIGVHGVGGI